MKRFLFVIFFILAFTNSVYAQGNETVVPDASYALSDDLESSNFFKSPLSKVMPEVRQKDNHEFTYSFDHQGRSYKEIDPDNMPLFKQMRLKLTNKIISLTNDDETAENAESDNNEYSVSQINKAKKSVVQKLKFWEKKEKVQANENNNLPYITEEGSIADSIQNQTCLLYTSPSPRD